MSRVGYIPAEHEGILASDARAQRMRAQLQLKVLPGAQFERLWASYGTLARCDGCNDVIETDEIEYELKFRYGAEGLTIKLHRECWETWRDE
ncbi:MAG TPA: hypothetical protein VFS52_21490 [Steroidobacteraceae bacterium]|jgi:hypothetical protein|nr:hypothetical protein [Steroidobacteraceae bacterium]